MTEHRDAHLLIAVWRQEAKTTERIMDEKYPGELDGSKEAEDYYAMESRAETLKSCADEMEAALSGDLDMSSSVSRQHRIDTGRFLTWKESDQANQAQPKISL